MLKAEKRHRHSCRFDQYDRARTKCTCSYHAIGVLNGTFLRRSLKTSNYQTAIRTIRKWELPGADAGRKAMRLYAPPHRLDEFPVGYSLAGCAPAEPAAASPTGSYYEPKGRRWPAKTSERSTVSKLFVSPRGQVQFAVRGSKARPQELSTSEFQLRASFRSGLSGILLVSLKCPCRGRFQVH